MSNHPNLKNDGQEENINLDKENFSNNVKNTSDVKWIDNDDNEVDQVFGFNKNAELVNSRAAMIGFLMLILTELAFQGKPATLAIFGIQ